MAIVSFWSNQNKEIGETMSIVALATYMAIQHNYKILIVDTNFNDDTIKSSFWEPNREQTVSSITNKMSDVATGIEGLAKAVMSRKSSPEIITNYTKVVFKDRLEILLGMQTTDYEEYRKTRTVYADILQFANRHYDLVLVDLPKGFDDDGFTKQLLGFSDLIMFNINQQMKTIESYIDVTKNNPEFQRENIMPLLGRYDIDSKYNAKNVARYIGERKEVCAVPYNTLFFESSNEGKIADFFIKFNAISDPYDTNFVFISYVKNLAERLIYKLQELQMKM